MKGLSAGVIDEEELGRLTDRRALGDAAVGLGATDPEPLGVSRGLDTLMAARMSTAASERGSARTAKQRRLAPVALRPR